MKNRRARFFLALFCCFAPIPGTINAASSLNVIVLSGKAEETYWAGRKSLQRLGAGDFPVKYTRLFLPVPPPRGMDLGLAVPSQVSTLDVNEWPLPGHGVEHEDRFRKKVETENKISGLSYRLEFLSTENPLKIRLKGQWLGWKFDQDDITVWSNRPTLAGVRKKGREGLFFALTVVRDNFPSKDSLVDSTGGSPYARVDSPPKLLHRTVPAFPRQLSGHSGEVVVLAVVKQDGSPDPERIRVIRTPHTLFLKSFLNEIFTHWKFQAGVKDERPVDTVVTLESAFETGSQP